MAGPASRPVHPLPQSPDRRPPVHTISRTILALIACGVSATTAVAAHAPPLVLEPAQPHAAVARKPERARWSWNQAMAEVSPKGDLTWQPKPFVYAPGK